MGGGGGGTNKHKKKQTLFAELTFNILIYVWKMCFKETEP